jgi:ribosomal protein S27AE
VSLAGGAYLFIALSFGIAGGIVGRIKGSSFVVWFLISGLVPFFGLLAAVCYRSEKAEERRSCPGCGRIVFLHDTLCTRCGTELYYPDEPGEIIPPELETGRLR